MKAADASFELLARRVLGRGARLLRGRAFHVSVERKFNAHGRARTRLAGGGENSHRRRGPHLRGGGQRPGQRARSRAAQGSRRLPEAHRGSRASRLSRARVPGRHRRGHARAYRVRRRHGARWSTVGVSGNIIDASFQALVDAIDYKLVKASAADRAKRPFCAFPDGRSKPIYGVPSQGGYGDKRTSK